MLPFTEMIFYFLTYAFLGWCAEVAFAAMKSGSFVNRGFLNGPYCPIYGFGALLVILCLTPLQHNLAALFLGSCAITTLLEYLTGAALEKLFHTRWWDYSDMPFNIHGHVCLLFSVLWGLACTFVMRIIQPMIAHLYALTPFPLMLSIVITLSAVMLADAIVTVLAVRKLTRSLQHITELAEDLRLLSDEIGESISDRAIDAKEWWDDSIRPKLDSLDERTEQYRESVTDAIEDLREKIDAANEAIESRRAEYRERIDDIEETLKEKRAQYRQRLQQLSGEFKRSFVENRMLNAYPHLKNLRNQQALDRLREYHDRLKRKRK